MRFAHMADCHIGSWRDPKLKQVSIDAFVKAIDTIIQKDVDFLLISGDLFNTSMPGIDTLKTTVQKLKQLKDKDIPVYIIAGSHDFSPSGKTVLEVLEHAGLCINVVKGSVQDNRLLLRYTIDPKTGAKITGMLGKKGMLERSYYESLDKTNLEQEPGFKIFMFHTALSEFKPKDLENMDSSPLSLLPRNHNYYAGGHVHYIFEKDEPNYGKIVYPGPLFPNNFAELEKLNTGGFYIWEDNITTYCPIQICNSFHIKIDAQNKAPDQIKQEINEIIENQEFINTIVTIRIKGTLASGKPSDVEFTKIFKQIYDKGAFFVMKNTSKLQKKDFEEVKSQGNVENIEETIIQEHLGQIKTGMSKEEELHLTKSLLNFLDTTRHEGEKVAEFEQKIKEEVLSLIKTV